MTDIAFKGEVQFRRYSDTSTQGQQIVFAVADREALEPFIGKEGKRYMAVFVEIGDDEQPVQPPTKPGPLCFEAIQYCKDPDFQRWAIERADLKGLPNANVARDVILGYCGIESRKDLDTVATAAEKFRTLIRAPFMRWQRERRR